MKKRQNVLLGVFLLMLLIFSNEIAFAKERAFLSYWSTPVCKEHVEKLLKEIKRCSWGAGSCTITRASARILLQRCGLV
jgi:hypothetical protein